MTARTDAVLAVDWLGLCRRAVDGARGALERHPLSADRAATAGRGMGGDMSLVIDRAVEDAVFAELEALGTGLTVVSEERGEVEIGGGGPVHVVVDPIDGSRNARRGLPSFALSIAVASGPSMDAVELGFVHDLTTGEEWRAARGAGAHLGDGPLGPPDPEGPLELLGVETSPPEQLAERAQALAATGAERLRTIGSVALALCWVAGGRLDGALTLRPIRSVDAAAAQLIVREAGGAVAFPDAGDGALSAGLDLEMRSRVVAACDPAHLATLLAV